MAEDQSSIKLTDAQKERIEQNRTKAKAVRKVRLAAKPYDTRHMHRTRETKTISEESAPVPKRSLFDSHGGYILEDGEESVKHNYRYVEDDAPTLPDEQMVCGECKRKFAESFLNSKFQLTVCNQCRNPSGKHSFITKTEAKQRFLLKDCDFEERSGAPLPYILKRNPHSSRWGDMKLYLLCQVQTLAYEIWGDEVGLENEHQRRNTLREKKKEKKYTKEIKELRRAVRSSTLQAGSQVHEHEFPLGKETYNSDTDTWTKTCVECGYQVTFEKM